MKLSEKVQNNKSGDLVVQIFREGERRNAAGSGLYMVHDVAKSGYLNKYRPYATSSLWANTWEPRYVVVRDESLMYFKNERDVYRNPPRGQLSLSGTYVEVEGLKRRKYWTFRVVDRQGVDLIRLSTESHS